jgi:hypothetical protein
MFFSLEMREGRPFQARAAAAGKARPPRIGRRTIGAIRAEEEPDLRRERLGSVDTNWSWIMTQRSEKIMFLFRSGFIKRRILL